MSTKGDGWVHKIENQQMLCSPGCVVWRIVHAYCLLPQRKGKLYDFYISRSSPRSVLMVVLMVPLCQWCSASGDVFNKYNVFLSLFLIRIIAYGKTCWIACRVLGAIVVYIIYYSLCEILFIFLGPISYLSFSAQANNFGFEHFEHIKWFSNMQRNSNKWLKQWQ